MDDAEIVDLDWLLRTKRRNSRKFVFDGCPQL